jgi:hypothetical protein
MVKQGYVYANWPINSALQFYLEGNLVFLGKRRELRNFECSYIPYGCERLIPESRFRRGVSFRTVGWFEGNNPAAEIASLCYRYPNSG